MIKLSIKHKGITVKLETDATFKTYVDLRETIKELIDKTVKSIDEES